MSSILRRVKRFRERFAQAIDPGSTPWNSAHGLTISNTNQNMNTHMGIGNIYNNNPITNNVFNAAAPSGLDPIQAKIASILQARHVPQAMYDAQLGSGCMDGTRVQVLRDIENWINNPKAPQIFWLAGMAGTGKSAIAWTVCSRANSDPKILLGGSFFCSRSTGLVAQRDVRCVIPTLAQLLARQSPKFSKALADELARNPDVLHKQVTAQVEQLLYKPMLALKGSRSPIIFVIDALDECGGQTSVNESDDAESHRIVSEILQAFVNFSRSSVKLPVKFFVTSRPETHIRDTPISDVAFSAVLRLHAVNKDQVTADIRLYISTRLRSSPQLRSRFTDKDVDTLARLCDGLFIVAATALHYSLGAGIDFAAIRFRTLFNSPRDGLGSEAAAPLDRMYALILMEAVRADGSEAAVLPDLQQLLASILVAQMPLSVVALSDLLYLSIDDLRASLSRLHAVIHVPDNDGEPGLRVLHASFGDYLFGRAPSHIRIHSSFGHTVFASACLRMMAKQLHFNISQSRSSYERNSRVKPNSITLSLEYACLQWAYHVAAVSDPSAFDKDINTIFRPRFLFWLEVMSVLGQIQRAAAMLIFVGATTQSLELSRFLRDATSFVASSREAIKTSAPHIYLSALPFAAKDSLVFEMFFPLCTGLVAVETFGIDHHGGRLIMTLTGPERGVNCIAYSRDGLLIIAGSQDGTVRIWDTRTSEEMMTPLRSGDGVVYSVAVSPNGDRVASGTERCHDVCLWSLFVKQTTPQRCSGHSAIVWSLAFSPDGSLLSSASLDTTVRIWKTETGQPLAVLRGHTDLVRVVVFSPDGELLASGSEDKTIRLWQSATGEPAAKHLIQHDKSIDSVCFAPDGSKLASISTTESLIQFWDPRTGMKVATLHGPLGIRSIQFSPDGQSLVVTTYDHNVHLWNLPEPSSMVLAGHTGAVRSAVFSPDGLYIASASDDRTIRIWAAGSGQVTVVPLQAHNHMVRSVVVASDGVVIVSGSADRSVCVWDAHTGNLKLPPLLGHAGSVSSVTISSNGRLIGSASDSESEDITIRFWDAQTGSAVDQPLQGYSGVDVVTFSPDARWLASKSNDRTLLVWNAATGQLSNIAPLSCKNVIRTVAFSPNGSLLAAGDAIGHIHFWQVETGQIAYGPLQAHDLDVNSINFSPDGARIVSATNYEVCRVWIVSTGQQALVLDTEAHLAIFSPNGRVIGTAGFDQTLGLWDAETGVQIGRMHGHVEFVSSLSFMPDGSSIVSCSADTTIRVWNIEAACSLFLKNNDGLTALLATTKLKDGWLSGSSDELHLWVPAEYRPYILVPPCTMLIGKHRVVITADEDGLCAGENWTACWRKNSFTIASRST